MTGTGGTPAAGLVLVDKPAAVTSHDVVAAVRRLAGTRRVGHAGTLDPMATGLLVLGLDRATRLLTYLVGVDKAYHATIRLGSATTTDDAEGEVIARREARDVDPAALVSAAARLTGDIEQVPSAVSAIKVDGRRAYARVRAGETLDLPARSVRVSRFVLGEPRPWNGDPSGGLDVDVEVECSSGTYVRALARDMGAALGVGGHLTALRRTRVGPFEVGEAHPLPALEAAVAAGESLPVEPPARMARRLFPVRDLTPEEARWVRHGRTLPALGLGEGPIAAIGPDGVLLALLAEDPRGARPLLVLER